MADSATEGRIAARARWKLWGLPVLAAVVAFALTALFDYHPVKALLNGAQNILLAFNQAEPDKSLLSAYPWLARILEWIAGPIVWLMLMLGIVKQPPVRALIDWLFPDPPSFVLTDLDDQRRRSMVLTNRPVAGFVGREAERAVLATLLDRTATPDPFRWRVLLGPSGIGKTRLAIEWLAEAQAAGWDVGIVDPRDHARLAGWRPRRPTALVIDEARSRWDKQLADALLALGARATARKPVRLLVLDQIEPYALHPGAAEQHRIDSAQITSALRIGALAAADIRAMLADDPALAARADRIVSESAGRPRAAILLAHFADATSYADALHRWADLLIPDLRDDSAAPAPDLAIPLIFAGLVGPVPAHAVSALTPGYQPGQLLRFFEDVDRATLEREIPPLLPDDLGQEVALRLLTTLNIPQREATVAALLGQAPERIEASLGAIWRDRPELDGVRRGDPIAATLRGLQAAFDEAHPDRVAALVEHAQTLVDKSADPGQASVLDASLEELVTLAQTRPFDPAIRLREATGAFIAINHYGAQRRWDDLERWGSRLIALATDDRFVADGEIRLREANGSVNAIAYYGAQQKWDDLERWGKKLIALAEDSRFAADRDIRLREAMGSSNAIIAYGEEHHWDHLERWGARLIALAEDSRFAADRDIRLREAMGSVAAIGDYGQKQKWDDLERWGKRLIALAEDGFFAADRDVRLFEARGSASAIGVYGQKHRWPDLERWGKRLIAVAEDSRFAADRDIRLGEARGSFNAITAYGQKHQWDDLERWGVRLIALAEDSRFAADREIRLVEAHASVNAIGFYGKEDRWDHLERWGERLIALAQDSRFADDHEIRLAEVTGSVAAIAVYGEKQHWDTLERWGKRLIVLAGDSRFAADREIRLQEARGAVNAIIEYGNAGLHGSGRHFAWKRRLAFVAQAFPTDPEIQELAQEHSLTWVSQQRAKFMPYGRAPALPPKA